ncbi:hypothetical protein [Paraburkholderia kururiensis]|uniref:hypothetical protein n=1 Tax=Paraburkholderia kururiensis TaxID=984307 RepID=UPI0039A42997
MKLVLSPPVQLALAFTLVGATLSTFQADPVELPVLSATTSSPLVTPGAVRSTRTESSAQPWARLQLPDPVVADTPKAGVAQSALPPLPPGGVPAGSGPPPPLPSGTAPPRSPTQEVAYLGRMIRDGTTQVFLSANEGDPVVLSTGDVLNDSWKIQSITSTAVTLKHIHSDEIRVIAMGGGVSDAVHGEGSTQVGQRFLASDPAGVYVKPVN